MSRTAKTKTVADLADQFRNASGAVLTEYRGLTVAQLRDLRNALRGNAEYAIVKNTLTKIAARDAGVEGFEDLLVGPSAIAFITGDPVETAKGLKNFGKDHPALVVKGGVLDGKALSPDEIKKLADLESREVLLSKLAGGMKAKMSQAAALFQAPLAKTARTVEALRVKAESDPSVLAAGTGAPAEEAAEAVTEAPAAPAEESAKAAADAPEAPAAPADEAVETPADTPSADAEAPAEAPAESTTEAAAAEDEASQEG